jgi:hypothetical protein
MTRTFLAVFQVMTPIKGRNGRSRWFHPLIVAENRIEAVRMAEQEALHQGFAYERDIEVQEIRHAVVQCPEPE